MVLFAFLSNMPNDELLQQQQQHFFNLKMPFSQLPPFSQVGQLIDP
jgi:hypothetical protein